MTSVIDLRSNDIRTRAQVTIEIPALDTREGIRQLRSQLEG